jgi:hypothetical protein
VNDVVGQQLISRRDFRLSSLATVERAAFCQKLWSRGAMNRAIDTTATQKRLVGGVDDRV